MESAAEHTSIASQIRCQNKSFRNQLNEDLSASLRNHLEENFSIIYSNALDYVKAKTNLTNLPELCPYSLEQILDKNWLP
ncbi:DUF29 family protein [Nostoc sp. C052]|uniref:DUF29 family protein n=1 Tax=Nostoc sp. C052 TaxID=2576902 RepID=UPI002118CBC7|nr:DUF29 family protein [Nostoc sp. C052]